MPEKKKRKDAGCPCSQRIDRRDFLKMTALAGLLAGCTPAQPSPTPTEEPTETPTKKPTASPTATLPPTVYPDLSGKNIVYVLPKETYADACHNASQEIFEKSGARITLAALEKKEIGVWGGGTPALMPDVTVSEVKAADFDAVIFECGQPMQIDEPEYLRLARETVEQNKVAGALCMMPVLLGAAGILIGKQATANSQFLSLLKATGAVVSDKNAVRDGKIVTCSYEGHVEFAWLVMEALREE